MRDIVERLRIEISEDRLGHPIEVMKEAADEIERLRSLVATLTDAANQFADEIDHLRGERKALDEALLQEIHRGSVRNERHHRVADEDTQRASGDPSAVA